MPISQRIWSSSPESDAVIMRLCHFLNDASIHEGITLTPQSPLARRSSEGRAPNCSNTDIFSSIIKRLNQCTSQTCQSCAVAPELFFSQFVMAVQSIPEARQHGSCPLGVTCGSADFPRIAGTSYGSRTSSWFDYGASHRECNLGDDNRSDSRPHGTAKACDCTLCRLLSHDQEA